MISFLYRVYFEECPVVSFHRLILYQSDFIAERYVTTGSSLQGEYYRGSLLKFKIRERPNFQIFK